jgi:catechol 2,3-dioxygenase-like lactoylglutathione lyase family enzyme
VLADSKLMAFVPTCDAERARAFYVDTLGLKFLEDDSFAVVVEVAGIKVRLVRIANHVPVKFTILGWEVADLDKAVRELVGRGVKFEQYGMPGQDARGIWTSPGGDKIAWFCDPDGNVLSLAQLVR